MTNLLFKQGDDWTLPTIENIVEEVEKIAVEELKLDLYTNKIEIVDFEGMINSYVSIGVPILYNHWSFGKSYNQKRKQYQEGHMGLALEMVINSSPCINYLLDHNDAVQQCLVLAHASAGHNSVFKNNHYFKTFTEADAIINYLKFAKNYIQKCEEKYGELVVENWLDSCHALQNQGINTSIRKYEKISEDHKAEKKSEDRIKFYDHVWESTVPRKIEEEVEKNDVILDKPEENILYFIEKNAKWLPVWQREIIRIIRRIAQYFYPQQLCKVLHEGMACFTHYYITSRMYDKGLIDEGSFIQFLKLHSGVIWQPSWKEEYYSGLNPYTLGFNIYRDVRRICEDPTEEDLFYLPHLKGVHWLDAIHDIIHNYHDSGLIAQFLSPKVIRDMKLFMVHDTQNEEYVIVNDIHDENGYNNIRRMLSTKYERMSHTPSVQVVGADLNGNRTLTLSYTPYNKRKLEHNNLEETLEHIENLWQFQVEFE